MKSKTIKRGTKVLEKEELKRLTWGYFIKQKLKEIGLFILIVVSIIFIPYLCGIWMKSTDLFSKWQFEQGILIWFDGLFFLIILAIAIALVGVGLSLIVLKIIKWFKSNWRKAEARAKEKLK